MLSFNNINYKNDLEYVAQNVEIPQKISILVTGATGLIGSFLIDFFIYCNRKYKTQNKIYGMSRHLKKIRDRFSYINEFDNFYPIEKDITTGIPEDIRFDLIFNCASNADPASYALYPAETILTNIIGTKNVLDYLRKFPDSKMVFTSTMEVYGCIENIKAITEDMYGVIDFNKIRSGYPESKRCSELLIKSYIEEYSVNAIITRLGYIYGPTMTSSDNKAVAQFINKALKKEDIVLKSPGKQRRSYCYIADTILGILIATLKGKNGETYNVSNSNSEITIAELADVIASESKQNVISDKPNNIEIKGSSPANDAVLSSDKLRELGYNPKYDIFTGIKKTLKILKSQ